MRFDVSSTALLSRLQSISKVIASKNSLPILDSFLFNLEGNKLTITASDAETRLVTSVDVMNAQGSGLFAVSAKILLDPLKELPEQPLTFDINDDNLEIFIHFQNGKYNFIGQKGDTYPQQKPLNENAISIMMDAQMLLNGISRSLFATADDELRPVMNGIYFDIHTDDLTFVASDGHKLVRLRNLSVKSPERASFILPKKPANLLKGLLSKEGEMVSIKFDDNNAYINCVNFQLKFVPNPPKTLPPDRRSLSELQQCDPAGKSFQGDNRPYLFPECLEACFRFLQSGQQPCQVAAEGERNACFRTGHRFFYFRRRENCLQF